MSTNDTSVSLPRIIVSLQYLRAVAAMMVIVSHMSGQLGRLGYTGPWLDWTASGVDIFFVISGFVMWLTTRARPTGTGAFYWHRIARVVPLYWALTSVTVGMMLIAPSLVQSGSLDFRQIMMSYAFLPALQPVSGAIQPVLEPGWTLNYEMYFYAGFGALLFLSDRKLLMAVFGWLLVTSVLGYFSVSQNIFVRFYGSDIVTEFGFGVALASAYLRGRILPAWLAWISLVAGIVLLTRPELAGLPRALGSGLPATAIVAGAVALECRLGVFKNRLMLLIGDASYSLYLSHGIVLSACGQIVRKLTNYRGPGLLAGFFAICFIAAIIAAVVIYFGLEKPLGKMLRPRKAPDRRLANVPA